MKKHVENIKERVSKNAYGKTALDVVEAFAGGVSSQALDEETVGLATMIGLYQGLKYNGSLERGVKAGVGSFAVMTSINGVVNVLRNADTIVVRHRAHKLGLK